MNAAATKEQDDLKAEIGNRKAEKLTPFGVELGLRRKLWAKPLDHAFPGIFGGVENGEAKSDVARLAKEVGLPAFLIGAAALEDAFRRDDAGNKNLFAAGEPVKGKYLSLWEVATKTFGVRDDLSAELLCQILFLGLSACAGGVEGGAGGDGVKGAEGVGVHAGDHTPGSEKGEAEKIWRVVCEGRHSLVYAWHVTCIFTPDKTGMYRFHNSAGEVVASFPVATTSYQIFWREDK